MRVFVTIGAALVLAFAVTTAQEQTKTKDLPETLVQRRRIQALEEQVFAMQVNLTNCQAQAALAKAGINLDESQKIIQSRGAELTASRKALTDALIKALGGDPATHEWDEATSSIKPKASPAAGTAP